MMIVQATEYSTHLSANGQFFADRTYRYPSGLLFETIGLESWELLDLISTTKIVSQGVQILPSCLFRTV